MRLRVATALLLAVTTSASGQMFSSGGTSNSNSPLLLNDSILPSQSVQTSTSGRTTATPTVGAGTLVLLVNGQSIPSNVAPSLYTPSNAAAVLQLNIYDQTVYRLKDPQLGVTGNGVTQGGSYISRLADKLVTDGKFTQVIVVNASWGGTSVADWANGQQNHRARVSCLAVRAKGWIGSGASFGIIYDQGQGDNGLTTSAQWQSRFAVWKQTFTGMGCNFHVFVPNYDTLLHNVTDATIQAAQAAVVDNVTVFAGANSDSLTGGTNRQGSGDDTHFTDVGSQANANLWATIIEAHY